MFGRWTVDRPDGADEDGARTWSAATAALASFRRGEAPRAARGSRAGGWFVLKGALWARTVGIVLAALSLIANFVFIPYHPAWSIVIMAMDVAAIWALRVYNRDAADWCSGHGRPSRSP